MEFEREKLDWGRGFFSYELCDLNLYTTTREDRRNCRIVTPGALIQDQVSLVFGTAIRQMEAADEFEERIAQNTIIVLNDILNWNGLTNIATSRMASFPPTTPLTPEQTLNDKIDGKPLITRGDFFAVRELFPWELTITVVDIDLSAPDGFKRLLLQEASEEKDPEVISI